MYLEEFMYIKSNKNQIDYKMNFILKCKTETIFFYICFTKTKNISLLSLTAQRHSRYSCREPSTNTPLCSVSVHALLRCPKFFVRCSLHRILTAAPTNTPCIRHRRRSYLLPLSKGGIHPIQLNNNRKVNSPPPVQLHFKYKINISLEN